VLPRAVTRRLAVEAGATQSWWRYVGSGGAVLGIDRFGASGKGADVFTHFGFTADNIAQHIRALLEG
jgi:transketolase